MDTLLIIIIIMALLAYELLYYLIITEGVFRLGEGVSNMPSTM